MGLKILLPPLYIVLSSFQFHLRYISNVSLVLCVFDLYYVSLCLISIVEHYLKKFVNVLLAKERIAYLLKVVNRILPEGSKSSEVQNLNPYESSSRLKFSSVNTISVLNPFPGSMRAISKSLNKLSEEMCSKIKEIMLNCY